MDIESFIQFADEHDLWFEHKRIESLDSLKLMFTNPRTRRAYTYYVSPYELKNVDKHNAVINHIKILVTQNLLQ